MNMVTSGCQNLDELELSAKAFHGILGRIMTDCTMVLNKSFIWIPSISIDNIS